LRDGAALGSVDGVFNNAGIGGMSPADTTPMKSFCA
jgi:NAD(P)-dependent dehydrogenase (short-subunit alcohol dehydrogenase family)